MILLSIVSALISLVSADDFITTQNLTAATGLTAQEISMGTQKDLEILLFYEDDGISCGLEEFTIEEYRATYDAQKNLEKFEVQTLVDGPVDYCAGTASYMCYTTWKKMDGAWVAYFSDCEFGNIFDE